MLSQVDIVKALGTSINIHPFNEKNLKENSYNLTASKWAFATKDSKFERYKIKKGMSCVVSKSGIEQIVLLPNSTTLIVTEELIGVTSIGGTYHSKVGMASIGLGHIGTMLGPNFCGHSLIALHNVSDEIKFINVGDTFVSVVFHKLDTPITDKNPTVNAHLDKFSQFGIQEDTSKINEDWKTNIRDVSDKMKQSDSYRSFMQKVGRYRFSRIKSYLSWPNFFVLMLMVSLILSPFILEFLSSKQFVASQTADSYRNFFYNIGLSGVVVVIFQGLNTLFQRKA